MGYSYKRFSGGMLGSNTYLLWDEASKEAMIIDPGNPLRETAEFAESAGVCVKYIVLTHAHYDHVCHVAEYKEHFGAPVACTAEESHNLTVSYLNASSMFGSAVEYGPADMLVCDGHSFGMGEDGGPSVIKTPGHTSGGICVLAGKYLFSGDTLFFGSFGRTDLGDGDMSLLKTSIDRLFELPEDTVVLPGHGTYSTIGREKKENPIWYY